MLGILQDQVYDNFEDSATSKVPQSLSLSFLNCVLKYLQFSKVYEALLEVLLLHLDSVLIFLQPNECICQQIFYTSQTILSSACLKIYKSRKYFHFFLEHSILLSVNRNAEA